MKKIFLIQGILFQDGEILGIGLDDEIGERVKVQKIMRYAIYHGIFSATKAGDVLGVMSDKYGESEIFNITLSKQELSFDKKYKNRPLIHYSFSKKDGNIWIGEFRGPDCGIGKSKCIITEVNESFFEYE